MLSITEAAGVIFDTDGVITDTARVHAEAWKDAFDTFLAERARRAGSRFLPFDAVEDYRRYVDGRPRNDGVRSFLASRGITLPDDVPEEDGGETVRTLSDRKNTFFLESLRRFGARPFPSTLALVRELRERGTATAVVSSSRNCHAVLTAAGALELFDVRVDGVEAARLGLPGKPDPALFHEAARRLGLGPARVAVIEDALAGVEAGRRGGFGLVVGVDRVGHAADLRRHGAHTVVADLAELSLPRQSA